MSGRVVRPADVFATTRGRSVVVGGRITAMRPHGALCFWDLTWDGSTLQLVGPGSTPLRRLDVVAVQGVVAESAGRAELQVEQVQWRRTPQDRCRSDVLPLLDPIRPAALRARVVEGTIGAMCAALRDLRAEAEVPDGTRPFPRVAYARVLEEIGLRATTGSQPPAAARRYLADRFPGFVWVVGFPAHTRPFFVRAENGTCFDAQLWYRGKTYLAAGGERETSPDEIVRRIEAEGKEVRRYEFFLEYLRSGLPPSVGMGMGIERGRTRSSLVSTLPNRCSRLPIPGSAGAATCESTISTCARATRRLRPR